MDGIFKKPFFVLEMANNHMGDVEHGLRIIRELGAICRKFPYQFAIKLQYRHLDSLIHPDYINRNDIKYIKRFSETRLSQEDFGRFVGEIKTQGMLAMCTPFDEAWKLRDAEAPSHLCLRVRVRWRFHHWTGPAADRGWRKSDLSCRMSSSAA